MKYLDILKEYDKAIISESKKLDDMYKKLLGESCETDAPTDADDEEKKVDEGCDKEKQMREFSEGEKKDGKSDKKMLSKEEFFKTDTDDDSEKDSDDGEKTDDDEAKKEEVDEDDILKGGQHNGHVGEA